ncbi:Retrovirus-related Pol polyprotein from transposon [Apostichopus japonicus]|uniref:Retrovirus-related Pol polyprotein from transposon n=1 Tax=Stichopus japonicus TaxID=307972 RepID=A0A2G8LC92_STIJA|nr:Retrovirus-related Pol polyprotein from transposon [Apostichopus japonicus]
MSESEGRRVGRVQDEELSFRRLVVKPLIFAKSKQMCLSILECPHLCAARVQRIAQTCAARVQRIARHLRCPSPADCPTPALPESSGLPDPCAARVQRIARHLRCPSQAECPKPVLPDTGGLQTSRLPDPCAAQSNLAMFIIGLCPTPLVSRQVLHCQTLAALHWWQRWDRLLLKGGVLYRKFETDAGDSELHQLVVPKEIQEEILDKSHNHRLSGHFMAKKTLKRIRELYYWSGYRGHVEKWCKSCDACASRKGPRKKANASLKQYGTGHVLQRCAMDIMGPLPVSSRVIGTSLS